MRVAELQIAPWEKILKAACHLDGLAVFDDVIIKTSQGLDLAKVVDLHESEQNPDKEEVEIIGRATAEDCQKVERGFNKNEAFRVCHNFIKQLNLNMKLVEARNSYDGNRLTFAFVANGRVDFRELVKELSQHFNKNIRLQQIGIRDEAKVVGDQGRCGHGLCCRDHLTKFSSVTSEVAEAQHLSGRGSDRLSGACGRLMCCLAYEAEGYKDLSAVLPKIGSQIQRDGKKGVVVSQNALKQSVEVKFFGAPGEDDYIAELPWQA